MKINNSLKKVLDDVAKVNEQDPQWVKDLRIMTDNKQPELKRYEIPESEAKPGDWYIFALAFEAGRDGYERIERCPYILKWREGEAKPGRVLLWLREAPAEREKKLEEALRWAIAALEGTNVPVFNSRKYNAARAALEGKE